MRASRADVANVVSTREEVTLLFGTLLSSGQAGESGAAQEIPVELTDRIIMSPHAARRLALMLEEVLRDYEARFGKLPDPRAKA